MDVARTNGVGLEAIEVPGGQHGFDSLDHTKESRAAVARAMIWVAGALREG
ncbi:hypothetical protein [Gandjariella thermophila]|uniref:Alpha/beta hydrolase fold-3 domain-containing protein n=1 Tax=Gandjariella thermophila TaxID=1931992 RepID=A0A4D4JCB8_9PSEU|nr:hypothetical protein [Gandjariella thermophila]GDY32650.1 hypothetical protein GTS_42830 [Gandjariella thermophila]